MGSTRKRRAQDHNEPPRVAEPAGDPAEAPAPEFTYDDIPTGYGSFTLRESAVLPFGVAQGQEERYPELVRRTLDRAERVMQGIAADGLAIHNLREQTRTILARMKAAA